VLIASIAVCFLILVPWTIRNYVAFHRLIPIRDNFGLELWLGNHEGVTDLFDNDFPVLDPTEYNRLGELRFMEVKREIALEFVYHHPAQFVRLSARRFVRFWTAPEGSAWLPLSLLAWVGMAVMLWRKRRGAVPFAVVILVFPVVYYITHVFSTYRHPAEPVIILLAAYAMVTAVESVGRRLFRSRSRDISLI
jgi:uncharacterized membrane protein